MNRIQQLRVAKGSESQRELAHIMTSQCNTPMTFATISRLESGQTDNPKYKTILALARYFGVSVEYLMGDSDDPKLSTQKKDKQELPPEAQIAMDTFYNKLKHLYDNKQG